MGKTTLATIVARQSGRAFEELSAVTSGVKDVRDVLARARRRLVGDGTETVLFIDEVHRFSKSQQDALLPAVENRDVTFIGATTENPSFSVIKPLLSRSVVVKLESLEPSDLATLIARAVEDKRGLNGEVKIDDAAVNEIIRMAGGDARKTLTILEAAAGAVTGDKAAKRRAAPDHHAGCGLAGHGRRHRALRQGRRRPLRRHLRIHQIDARLRPGCRDTLLARMLRAGEDPRFIARRIMIAASEEVGMAAPQILQVTVAAAQAVAMIGMPEARIILAEATIAVATAPKSNASYNAINQALADVDAGLIGQVPLYLRNAPTALMKSWGNHDGYRYAHDWPGAVAPQEYLPEELRAASTIIPTTADTSTRSASAWTKSAPSCTVKPRRTAIPSPKSRTDKSPRPAGLPSGSEAGSSSSQPPLRPRPAIRYTVMWPDAVWVS